MYVTDCDVLYIEEPTVLTVVLSGPIDLAAYEPLRIELVERLHDDNRDIVLDLDGVEYLDSTGLRLLVEVAALASRHRRRCVVALGGASPCRTMFAISGVADVLDVTDTAADARAALAASP